MLLRDVRAFCQKADAYLDAFLDLLNCAEKRLPITRTGFFALGERRAAQDVACGLLSRSEGVLARLQGLSAEWLAFDHRLLAIDAMIDQRAAYNAANGEADSLAGTRNTLEQTARICKALQPSITRFCFTDLPNFYTCIEKNVDFEGKGAQCMPLAIGRLCADMRRSASALKGHILNVESFCAFEERELLR